MSRDPLEENAPKPQTPALRLNNFGAKGFGGRWRALGAAGAAGSPKGRAGGRAPAPWIPGSSRAPRGGCGSLQGSRRRSRGAGHVTAGPHPGAPPRPARARRSSRARERTRVCGRGVRARPRRAAGARTPRGRRPAGPALPPSLRGAPGPPCPARPASQTAGSRPPPARPGRRGAPPPRPRAAEPEPEPRAERPEKPQGPAEAARWRTSCRRGPCCPCASRAAC